MESPISCSRVILFSQAKVLAFDYRLEVLSFHSQEETSERRTHVSGRSFNATLKPKRYPVYSVNFTRNLLLLIFYFSRKTFPGVLHKVGRVGRFHNVGILEILSRFHSMKPALTDSGYFFNFVI